MAFLSSGYITKDSIKDGAFYERINAEAYGMFMRKRAEKGEFGQSANPDLIHNAARHLYWQAVLTVKHSALSATCIGLAHEAGEQASDPDHLMDVYNNRIGRKIGLDIIDTITKENQIRHIASYASLDIEHFSPDGKLYISNANTAQVNLFIRRQLFQRIEKAIKDGLPITDPNDPRLKAQ